MSITDSISDPDFKSWKRNKTGGIGAINSNIVLNTCDETKDTLFLIFKTSLQQGTFPNKIKIANVTPLFKPNDAESVTTISQFQLFQYFQKFLGESWTKK